MGAACRNGHKVLARSSHEEGTLNPSKLHLKGVPVGGTRKRIVTRKARTWRHAVGPTATAQGDTMRLIHGHAETRSACGLNGM